MNIHTVEDAISCQEQAAEAAARMDLAAAVSIAAKAAFIMEQVEGPFSPDVANLLTDLASYQDRAGRYAEARASSSRANEMLEVLEDEYPGDATLAKLRLNALGQYGTALRNTGDLTGAEKRFRQAIEIGVRAFGSESEEVAIACNSLGIVLKYSEKFEEAHVQYERALCILERLHGAGSLETATIWHNIGGLFHAEGRFAEAEEPGRKAWEIRREAQGDEVPETWFDAVAYAGILDGLDRREESEPIYREALKRYEKWFGPEHFEVAALLNNLARVLAEREEFGEALAMMQRSVALKAAIFPEGHFERTISEAGLAEIERMSHEAGHGRDTRPCHTASE